MRQLEIITADSAEHLPTMAECSVDAVVTDPPYALTNRVIDGAKCAACGWLGTGDLRFFAGDCPQCGEPLKRERQYRGKGFMGKAWDNGEIAFDPSFWAAVLRVMKPGAHALIFGGSRTHHRLFCSVEDAGFELRDCICWNFATGFPKNKNLGDGLGTALKPAIEMICLARKPISEKSIAANVLKWGCGGLRIDESRIGFAKGDSTGSAKSAGLGSLNTSQKFFNGLPAKISPPHSEGRWPANLLLSCSEACTESSHHESCTIAVLDRQSGETRSAGLYPSDSQGTGSGVAFMPLKHQGTLYDDTGFASRYFMRFPYEPLVYIPKSSTAERERGLYALASEKVNDGRETPIDNPYQRGETKRRNLHPTVKPIALMTYLCRLITPEGGTVLDPFCGSGSTGIAAARLGLNFIGIEREPVYAEIARMRIEEDQPLFNRQAPPAEAEPQAEQGELF